MTDPLHAPFPWFGVDNPFPWFQSPQMNSATVSRFWKYVKKTRGCWLWTGSKRNKGYGAFVWSERGRVIQGRAHRFSYELHFGSIPKGKCALHSCDVPACVNPEHIWIGSRKENNLDMVAKKRHRPGGSKTPIADCRYERGEHHHNARLTQEEVSKIRTERKSGMSYGKIALTHGISVAHAFRVANKKAWA